MTPGSTRNGDLAYATNEDLEWIWEHNTSVASSIEGTVHDIITQWTNERPDAPAVAAWDGDLTYAQLDCLAGKLAHLLLRHGARSGSIVPIYLPKSKWMPIAMLGVIKSGATVVLLDHNQPKARLEEILLQTNAEVVVTSPSLLGTVPGGGSTALIELTDFLVDSLESSHLHAQVSPSELVYVTYTSGSTGSPKGACMSHANICSAVHYQSQLLGFDQSSRVLDFAPYSFDVAWSNFFHTLCAGGCLCIAREDEMFEDLSAAINAYRCTLINITPTVLRTLPPGPKTLKTILLSGEMPYRENVTQWAHLVRLINTYGPAECTFKSTFSVLDSSQSGLPAIGQGVGQCMWLVHPENNTRLAPIGTVGELYLEGPLVGQGYLHAPELTAVSFVVDPQWLTSGSPTRPGRRGKVYRTGDLAKYRSSDGQIVFAGRKDASQLKIRGQRVELGDVEHHCRLLLPDELFFVVDVVQPHDTTSPLLAMFAEDVKQGGQMLGPAIEELCRELPSTLPSYMHPALYLRVERIPRGPTGKVDRRALRAWAGEMTLSRLLEIQATVLGRHVYAEPADDKERQLRDVWADILGLSSASVSMGDNFLRMGGDSIKAIRIVSALRRQGMVIRIADIFQTSSLQELAAKIEVATDQDQSRSMPLSAPFSLISTAFEHGSIRSSAAAACRVDVEKIEDILPCTPIQQGMMAMASTEDDGYVLQASYQLPKDIDLARFRSAWLKVADEASILRTRIVDIPGPGLVQVVVRDDLWERNLNDVGNAEWDYPMGLGEPTCSATLQLESTGHYAFIMRWHHAIFDGWSRSMILKAVQDIYKQRETVPFLFSFRPFVQHVLDCIARPKVVDYWNVQLENYEASSFPPAPRPEGPKAQLHRHIEDLRWPREVATPSSIIRTALALLLAKYTNSSDVVFGATVSGRQAAIQHIDRIAGPTIATVPVRVKMSPEETVEKLLEKIQEQMIGMLDYEQYGLQNIQKLAGRPGSADAALFQLLLVVEYEETSSHGDDEADLLLPSHGSSARSLSAFNSYGMMLVCSLTENGLAIDVNYNTTSIATVECERFVAQLEHLIRMLCTVDQASLDLRDVSAVSDRDLQQIRAWNSTPLKETNKSVSEMIHAHVLSHPEEVAIDAWDYRLTYRSLWHRSTLLAGELRKYDVRGSMVILCLEKSSWMAVAMLGILRAGGTAVSLSYPCSGDRARQVVELCRPKAAIVTSPESSFVNLIPSLHVEDLIATGDGKTEPIDTDFKVALSDPAVVVMSSGTTASAKGILWSHSTLATNVSAAVDAFGINNNSRVLQFSAYDFDVSVVETLAALSAGSCICVPPQSDLLNDLSGTFQKYKANWTCLTPSVADTLHPKDTQTLGTIVFAGEKLKHTTARAWIEARLTVYNWYGPAEASVATHCQIRDLDWPAGLIGRSSAARAVIVDISNPTQLAPIGAVGELCLQGNVVADGYIGTVGRLREHESFGGIFPLQDLGADSHPIFRTGDHVKYTTDGNIVYLGRGEDSWRKWHGRRIQLDEIERAAETFCPDGRKIRVVADITALAEADSESLVLFVLVTGPTALDNGITVGPDTPVDHLTSLRDYLAHRLPAYMMPTAVVPVARLPVGPTGKIDRKSLRHYAGSLSPSELVKMQPAPEATEKPTSAIEKCLQRLWSSILRLDPDQIHKNGHFFRLGGDSICAMRLVAMARDEGLHFTTSQVFLHPFLSQLANVADANHCEIVETHAPFSLLGSGIDKAGLLSTAARLCHVQASKIENIYPCTALQQGLLALTAQDPGKYTSRSVLELQHDIDASRVKHAWLATVQDLPILRTRIVDLPSQGLMQVVVTSLNLREACDVQEYLREESEQPMTLGTELCRAAWIGRSFVLTIHHSIYDGKSLSMMLDKFEANYFDQGHRVITSPFDSFVSYTSRLDVDAAKAFWKAQLSGPTLNIFPELPTSQYQPLAAKEVTQVIALAWPRNGFTPTIIIRSAWAIIAARFSWSTNVLFGTVLSGRDIDIPGIEHCAGPVVCTIPIAVNINWEQSVVDFQTELQQQALATVPYQHYGLQNIAVVAENLEHQGIFQTLLVVQPKSEGSGLDTGNLIFKPRSFASTLETQGTDPFTSHALKVSCWLEESGMRLTISFDEAVLGVQQVETLAAQFESVLRQVCHHPSKTLGEIHAISREDLELFWQQNVKLLSKTRDSILSFGEPQASPAPKRNDSPLSLSSDPNDKTQARYRQQAANVCQISEEEIEDMYPCTPLQQSLIALSERQPGDYVGHDILPLTSSVDVARFQAAWTAVATASPILRTRIVDIAGHGLMQVVVRSPGAWSSASTLEEYHNEEVETPLSLGYPLVRHGIVYDSSSRRGPLFALTMHHALYDGMTNMLIRDALETYYQQKKLPALSPFRHFVDYILSQDTDATLDFWRQQFNDLEAPQFPPLPHDQYHPRSKSLHRFSVTELGWRRDDVVPSTIVRAAWAMICSSYTNSTDVVFGAIVSGRQVAVKNVHQIVGPTIAALPIRIKVNHESEVGVFLEKVQTQAVEMVPYEQVGISRISSASDHARQACKFQSMLVIQPRQSMNLSDSSCFAFDSEEPESLGKYHKFNSHALMAICTMGNNDVSIELSFDAFVIDPETVGRLAEHFAKVIRGLCCIDSRAPLSEVELITEHEIEQLWRWNQAVESAGDVFVHEIIQNLAHTQPDAVAISAWDGQLTYAELDHSSDQIASLITCSRTTCNKIVPICFEKSRWTAAAFLGVVKAGKAVLMLDPHLPEARLAAMMEQVKPSLIISSRDNQTLCERLAPTVLLASTEALSGSLGNGDTHTSLEIPRISPADLLYVSYTSGSTGVPKGCMISHQNFSTAVLRQRQDLGLDRTSRMYDFSSYSFDASYWCLLHTLCAGGTLCVPSDSERHDNLTQSMRFYHTTDVFLTPATAKTVDPSAIPTLQRVFLGGEKVTADDLTPWRKHTEVTIVYGPAECSVWATGWKVPEIVPADVSIGQGVAQRTWIVNPMNHNQLCPIGMVGELCLEGPLVGQGYLNDEYSTKQSFIEDPAWLLKGTSGYRGRHGRIYKTGDLVKYDTSDGSITFVGRKDSQIKLRGQRLELEEVEQHVRKCLSRRGLRLSTAAQVIVPKATDRAMLVAFLEMGQEEWSRSRDLIADMGLELAGLIPSYMVPTFLPVETIPLSSSGKIDRKALARVGDGVELAQLTGASSSEVTPPSTEQERTLQRLWARVLHIPLDAIGSNSEFFRSSGDSITAMQLTTLARQEGLSLTVADIMGNPRLSDMAKTMNEAADSKSFQSVKPFSLLQDPGNAKEIRREVARQCGVDVEWVEDVYPCTAVQTSLLAGTSRRSGHYISRLTIELVADADTERLKAAWNDVCNTTAPILRNRIVSISGEGFVQAQIGLPLEWSQHDSMADFVEHDGQKPVGLGSALARLALVEEKDTGKRFNILVQHHAVYDRVSVQLLLQGIAHAYEGVGQHARPAPFQNYLRYLVSTNKQKAKEFWARQFSGCEAAAFPALPSEQYHPQADSTLSLEIEDISWPTQGVTRATVLRAAWTLLSASYTDSTDVVFGVLSTGRQAPVADVERIVAPLIAALPVRVTFDPEATVQDLLTQLHSQSLELIPYEQTELTEIRKSSDDAATGARYNTLLNIQHTGQTADVISVSGPFSHCSGQSGKLDHFNPNAIMVSCLLRNHGGLTVEFNFDSKVISVAQGKLLVNHFEQVLRQICVSGTRKLEDISPVSSHDLDLIWSWNATVPETNSTSIPEMFRAACSTHPSDQAISSHDGELSYRELDEISDKLAKRLISSGVGPGHSITLCFEKSMWMPVAAMGAIKTGATCVSIDCTQPEGRLRTIIGKIKPRVILTSSKNEAMAHRLSDEEISVIVAPGDFQQPDLQADMLELPHVRPDSVLYIVLTSGSTGEPKGVVVTHQAFASAVKYQKEALHVKRGARVFDFVSYSFDVAWSNLLNTLLCGACLCIPSEEERKNDIVGAFNRLRADYSYFTPSVARLLDPSSMPRLRVLAMGGEPIPATEVARWRQADTIIGIYGPAECAQAFCITELRGGRPSSYVGHSFGARSWLVKPGCPDRLAAVGAVGELVIEGPALAEGYWNSPAQTIATFLEPPIWLSSGAPGHSGRNSRIYKTGDLLRYNPDGGLTFVGRKDQMVKLRGQRIELSEVEHHVMARLKNFPLLCRSVAAEVIKPSNSKAPILAVFIGLATDGPQHSKLDRLIKLSKILEDVEEDLREILPQYMVPGAYIPLDEIPITTTNKIDRRALREIGKKETLENLAGLQSQGSTQKGPTTEMERRLQQLWSAVLGIEHSSIKSQSSFLRIGGESISAMRLVARAREAGISFTVADIFKNPRLCQLAEVAREITGPVHTVELQPRKPFSSLPVEEDAHMDFLYDRIEPLLKDVEADDIQEVLPASDFQKLAVREALQDPPGRFPHWVLDLPPAVDIGRLRWSCKRLCEQFDILRTLFVELDGEFWQVQVSNLKLKLDVFKIGEDEDVDAAVARECEKDLAQPRRLGQSFIRFLAIVHPSQQSKFVLRMSHAQFDGYSFGSMLNTLSSLYLRQDIPEPKHSFGDYISFSEQQKPASLTYWRSQLRGAPEPPSSDVDRLGGDSTPEDRLSQTTSMPLPRPQDCQGIPLATLFHAACAMVLARHFAQNEIILGRLVTGRAMLPTALQEVVGPTLVELPIRFCYDNEAEIHDVARALQSRFIEDSSHEAAGMTEIIRQATNWGKECEDFGWRTAFQQEESDFFPFLGVEKATVTVFDRPHLPRRRPEIYATPRGGKLELHFEGNGKLIDKNVVSDLLERIVQELGRLNRT